MVRYRSGHSGGKPLDSGIPYIIWLIPGILPWFFFSETLSQGVSCLRKNSHLITKMVFPVSTIPVFSVISYMIPHLFLVGLMILLFSLTGYGPTIYWLQLPYYLLTFFWFNAIICMLISTLSTFSRDFEHLIKSVLTVLFWMTPILWNIKTLPGLGQRLLKLNPFYYFVEGYRNMFVEGKWFLESRYTLYFLGIMCLLSLFTAGLFGKLSKDFADVL